MTPKERNALKLRLDIYEIALNEFLLAREAGISCKDEDLDYEDNDPIWYACFCWYFSHFMKINIWRRSDPNYIKFKDAFPELYETKPKVDLYVVNWFEFWDLDNRIKCLQKAIEITERKLK